MERERNDSMFVQDYYEVALVTVMSVGIVIASFSVTWIGGLWGSGGGDPAPISHQWFMCAVFLLAVVLIFTTYLVLVPKMVKRKPHYIWSLLHGSIMFELLAFQVLGTLYLWRNPNYTHLLPKDPSGGLDDFRDLLDNSWIFKLVLLSLFVIQGNGIYLAIKDGYVGLAETYYDVDEDPKSSPFLNPVDPPPNDVESSPTDAEDEHENDGVCIQTEASSIFLVHEVGYRGALRQSSYSDVDEDEDPDKTPLLNPVEPPSNVVESGSTNANDEHPNNDVRIQI